jgi:hypothetical protein
MELINGRTQFDLIMEYEQGDLDEESTISRILGVFHCGRE